MKLQVVLTSRILASALLLLSTSCATSPRGSASGSGAATEKAKVEEVDPALTVEEAQSAVVANPEDAEARFRLGVAWQRRAEKSGDNLGKAYLDSARVAFEDVLARDSTHVKALVHSGLVLEDLNRPDEALQRYTRATEVAPQDPRPHVNLGSLLYFRFKRSYDAKLALMKAIELDPDNPDAHFNLGVMFADATLYREARAEWERVAAGPDGPAKELARQNLEKIKPLLVEQDAASTSGAAADSAGAVSPPSDTTSGKGAPADKTSGKGAPADTTSKGSAQQSATQP